MRQQVLLVGRTMLLLLFGIVRISLSIRIPSVVIIFAVIIEAFIIYLKYVRYPDRDFFKAELIYTIGLVLLVLIATLGLELMI